MNKKPFEYISPLPKVGRGNNKRRHASQIGIHTEKLFRLARFAAVTSLDFRITSHSA